MKNQEIRWKNGARVKVDAQKAAAEMDRVRNSNNGYLTAEALVNEAAKKRNPLHEEFEWDDSIAALEHRKARAQYLMRNVEIILLEDKSGNHPIRRYQLEKQPGNPQSVYTPTEEIMADKDRRAKLLQEALTKLMQWRLKYRSLNELGIIFREHERLISEIGDQELSNSP